MLWEGLHHLGLDQPGVFVTMAVVAKVYMTMGLCKPGIYITMFSSAARQLQWGDGWPEAVQSEVAKALDTGQH